MDVFVQILSCLLEEECHRFRIGLGSEELEVSIFVCGCSDAENMQVRFFVASRFVDYLNLIAQPRGRPVPVVGTSLQIVWSFQ